ncbi:xanthine dehydrogenase family protein subunit M [Pseudonocardia zijingensis]|uniref:Xanthine dehydrogenase family protein subunit M n=1 Tax=Pseudonocardia zijingensis TaxID=153376 RepID=A0ABN1P6G5_9PSEU
MIPPQFDYVRPRSVEEAVAALGEHGRDGDAKVLAGGQSLLPVLRLRLGYPTVLVDLGRAAGFHGVREEADTLVIGAMTTHHEVMTSKLVRAHCGLLAEATSTVADPAVRHRGTFGGSLSHADPAGDLPAVARAFDATMVVAGPGRLRTAPASEFFLGHMTTALEPEEVLVAVRLPKLGSDWGYRYEKFTRVAQSWAIVGVAALVRRSNGVIAEARIGLTNMGSTPERATATEDALTGRAPTDDAVASAAALAAEGTAPPSDLNGRADYREHLARVLTRRAVLAAAMRTR